jgi:hypothetical protein
VEEVTDEPLYRDRVCGIDIGKAGMVATIRVPSDRDPARRAAETRSFGTTKKEVLALADWLRGWQVPAAVMEATEVDSSVTISMPSFFSWRPSVRTAFIRAFTVHTVLRRAPGRDGCGVRVHTIPVSFATSTAATRSWTRSCSSSSITCGLLTAASYA